MTESNFIFDGSTPPPPTGDNLINDTVGRSTLIGTEAADTFVMLADAEKDDIQGFDVTNDVIDISAWGASSLDDLWINQDGANQIIVFGDERIELRSFSDTLTESNFIFDGSTPPPPSGDNLINDTVGRSTLTGTETADTFVMLADAEKDDIQGFDVTNDVIDISAWGASSLDDLWVNQDGANQIIVFGDERIELRSFSDTLTESNFIFDGSTPPPPTGDNLINDIVGRSTLIGTEAADTFVMLADAEKDDIQGFDVTNDVIDISAWGASSLDDLWVNQDGANQIIVFGDERIELRSFSDTLTESDFIFS